MSTQQNRPRRKRKAATNAIREIKKEQGRVKTIIPVAPFNRVTQEIGQEFRKDIRFKGEAHQALHIAAEAHLVDLFQNANKLAIHNGRETVQRKDLRLAQDLMNE